MARKTFDAQVYITSIDINRLSQPLYVGGRTEPIGAVNGFEEVTFEGTVIGADGAQALLNSMHGRSHGFNLGFVREEWRCIWCSSPNPLEHRHCDSCGGPRGWIL